MNKNKLKYLASSILVAGVFCSMPVSAKSFEGVIKGAECHLYEKLCDDQGSDIKHYFEKDFVLVSGDEYYLLDNLPLSEKLRLNNQPVRISGDLNHQRISVNTVQSNIHGAYRVIWDWDNIQHELYEN